MSRPRAAIVVTGSELVRGERTDLNGPFLAQQALSLGLEPVRIAIVGDAPAELEAALRQAIGGCDLLLVSGGLGPTHDDRTVELLARAAGVELAVDEELAAAIEELSRRIAARLHRPYADFAAGVRKQAALPAGATWIGLVGTAPAVILEHARGVAVALPGPPRELQELWPRVLETASLRRLLGRARTPDRRVLRLFGVSESAVAAALAEAGGEGDGVEVTICARDFEIHIDLIAHADAGARARADELERRLVTATAPYLFSRDERSTAELVLDLLRARGLTLATAESCTGGLVATRLTAVPGASDVFEGAVVAYSDGLKSAELDVPEALLLAHGAVSAEVAAAMARGARARLGTDVAVAVTGVAGPGGGTVEKPVGLVFLHASGPDAELAVRLDVPGDRETIRLRSTVAALHLVRRLVTKPAHS